jgi:cell division protein FtsQ
MRRVIAQARPRPATKRGGKPAHRRTRHRFDRRRTVRVGLGVSLVLSLIGTAWLWHNGWLGRQAERMADAAYRLTAEAGFAVDDVLVEGRGRTERTAILAALRVERGTPILAVDPRAARARLEALPWVRQATVERRLPRLLYIHLTERSPLALWQLDGKLSVIDRRGEVIPGVTAKLFARLPLVVGQGAPGHAAALVAMLDREPGLRPLVTAAVRVGGRRWNLLLRGGIDVRLPETDAAEAWMQLARLEREHGLLGRDVVAVDLRLPGRLVVRTAPGARMGNGVSKAGRNT